MNKLIGMNFVYETLSPPDKPYEVCLYVDTVTLLLPEELSLVFENFHQITLPTSDSNIRIMAKLSHLHPDRISEACRCLGIKCSKLNYKFFSKRLSDIRLLSTNTECVYSSNSVPLPITIKEAFLTFADGRKLDLTEHICIHTLNKLALGDCALAA